MSIDPNTLPDGTVVETNNGNLHFKDGDGRQVVRGRLGDGDPYPWSGRIIVRTYTPDPTPDQEDTCSTRPPRPTRTPKRSRSWRGPLTTHCPALCRGTTVAT